MLTDLQKAAAKLQGQYILSAEAVASRLGVPVTDVEAWEKLPAYDEARAEGLLEGAFAQADAMFGVTRDEA